MKFWAHSDPGGLPADANNARWQLLSEHLENVSALARRLAKLAAPGDVSFHQLAESCGLLHDFGKYSDAFQRMITSGQGRCQHAVHGAAIAFFGTGEPHPPKALHVSLAVAGHHAGIPNVKGGERSLEAKIKTHRYDALALLSRAITDCNQLRQVLANPVPPLDTALESHFDLYTRMLFSCLVDADRLDTAGQPVVQEPLNATERLGKLLAHIDGIYSRTPDGAVKKARAEVLQDCLAAASLPDRLLSLTVPTGGGKTLASMACALKRVELYPTQYRRIITVIPYLSIIEQNATIYKNIFGNEAVLEHHSGSFDTLSPKDDEHFVPIGDDETENYLITQQRHTETENWDSPLIVTTSVRFFESLFSNRPSDLRRAHNIARSIIILDEVQTLPRRLLSPLLAMIKELSEHWGCTFLFCTATQPALQRPESAPLDSRWQSGTIREIVKHPEQIRSVLKRVHIEWELEKPIAWADLASRISAEHQCLTVVNLRDHASALFDELNAVMLNRSGSVEGVIHLSTRMCAAHRLDALATIKQRLKENLPCLVVSTQLVEAGVDLDFPVVFRALGPLDAIFQAAGRADREGRLTEVLGRPGGRVIVFIPEDRRLPPNEYKEATGKTEVIARESAPQTDSANAIQRYFERYYGEAAELGDKLQRLRTLEEGYQFATLADEFEMISSRTRDIFVPYDDQARAAIEELRQSRRLTRELRMRLQRYVVGLYPNEFSKARGALEEILPGEEVWVAVEQAYAQNKGLCFQIAAECYIA
ncbi:MAG TPA: CRISPR-associated helicase Cas3' [Candidatus Angelobacter sp.]|nr:CRISPR-associated helicase Cas3' [Candidatus Angelobacter sp.]